MSGAFGHKYIKSHQHIWQKDYRSICWRWGTAKNCACHKNNSVKTA